VLPAASPCCADFDDFVVSCLALGGIEAQHGTGLLLIAKGLRRCCGRMV
jgi:hypothetical protein